jgi:hypothetical protein
LKVKALKEIAWTENGRGVRPGGEGKHARKEYGKYKICDERFYSCWVPGFVGPIFSDWFWS